MDRIVGIVQQIRNLLVVKLFQILLHIQNQLWWYFVIANLKIARCKRKLRKNQLMKSNHTFV